MLTACDSRQTAAKQAALATPSAPAPARPCNTIAMGRRNFLQARRDASEGTTQSSWTSSLLHFAPSQIPAKMRLEEETKKKGDPGEQGGQQEEREA